MNPEIMLIKAVCLKMVYNHKNDIESLLKSKDIDWRLLKFLLGYHELGPIFYPELKGHKEYLLTEIFQYLKSCYYYALANNLQKDYEYRILDSAFRKKGIDLLPIKGMALLNDVYSRSFLRPMSDIDVLAKEHDIKEITCILEGTGYRKELSGLKEAYWRKRQCHLTFMKTIAENSIVLDVHWDLDFKRKARHILPRLWDRIREIQVGERRIKLPSLEDTFFSLVLHKRRFGYILSLKNVLDAGLLLEKYRDSLDWGYIMKEASEGGMKAPLYFMLSQIRFLVDTDMSPSFMRKISLPCMLKRSINRFIEKNTFLESNVSDCKGRYLSGHFLLYDNFLEPIEYILDIPREQFAKFYGLKAYDKKTDFLYKNRLLYMPLKFVHKFISL